MRAPAYRTRYFVAAPPPEPLLGRIEQYRRERGFHSSSEPHVTVKAPFYPLGAPGPSAGSPGAATATAEHLAAAVRGGAPFSIRLTGPGSFGDGVTFAAVEADPGLQEIHERVVRALDGRVENIGDPAHELAGYHPHLTLAQGRDPALHAAMQADIHLIVPARFEVRSLWLYVKTGPGTANPWQRWRELPLG